MKSGTAMIKDTLECRQSHLKIGVVATRKYWLFIAIRNLSVLFLAIPGVILQLSFMNLWIVTLQVISLLYSGPPNLFPDIKFMVFSYYFLIK